MTIPPPYSPELPVASEVEPPDKKKKKKEKGGIGSSRGIETMFKSSYRVNMDLSALADTKANIMITINGLMLSVLLGAISSKIDANPWLLYPTTILLLACLISLVFAVLSARPRVQSEPVTLDQVRNDKANILFFGNFANMQRDEFLTGMKELMQNTDSLYQNMILDIYGLGIVLRKKYRLLRISYSVFMIGLVIGVLAFIVTFYFAAQAGIPLREASTPIPGLSQ